MTTGIGIGPKGALADHVIVADLIDVLPARDIECRAARNRLRRKGRNEGRRFEFRYHQSVERVDRECYADRYCKTYEQVGDRFIRKDRYHAANATTEPQDKSSNPAIIKIISPRASIMTTDCWRNTLIRLVDVRKFSLANVHTTINIIRIKMRLYLLKKFFFP